MHLGTGHLRGEDHGERAIRGKDHGERAIRPRVEDHGQRTGERDTWNMAEQYNMCDRLQGELVEV